MTTTNDDIFNANIKEFVRRQPAWKIAELIRAAGDPDDCKACIFFKWLFDEEGKPVASCGLDFDQELEKAMDDKLCPVGNGAPSLSAYYEDELLSHNDEALRYMIASNHNIIYPVYRNRLMGFLWRKTHWKCFITGWECNGKTFDKNTPESEMVDPPKPPVFKPYKDLPEVTRDDGST